MADQVLSQEEVDALLFSMKSGDIDLEVSAEEKEAQPEEQIPVYDLTSQNIMMREQFDVLDEVFDRFANSLRNSLGTSLRTPIDAVLSSTEMVKFGDFLEGLPNPSSFHTFRMEPLIGSALIAVEPNLVFFLIDCMFGGNGKSMVQQERDFTLIEQRVMRKFATETLKDLEKAWEFVKALRLSLGKSETKQQFVRLVAPSDFVIAAGFSVTLEEFSGQLWLCIPYLLLEPIKDKLSYRNLREAELENAWNTQLQQLLSDTEVTLSVELGKSQRRVGDVLNLKEGDVIRLDTGPQSPIAVMIEKIPKLLGVPGVVAGNRAVQITDLVNVSNGRE
ncbi:MAG: flagellar motor switch protein FliM [Deltaproteobacteria bacterium]|nr:flagellar motor switch protein FliM [Deltaproteobacteria bacterium]